MNYYQPRELSDENGNPTGLWHYTCRNDNHIYAVGYCSRWETCLECEGHGYSISIFKHRSTGKSEEISPFKTNECQKCNNKGVIERENPCQGHSTPDEAREHFRQYVLDNTQYDGQYSNSQHKCEVCGNWTQGFTSHPESSDHILCDEHRNKEGLSKVLEIGNLITS